MAFNILIASFFNIVLAQKNITELALELNKPSVTIQADNANSSNLSSTGKKGIALVAGKKLRTKKQMTTIKQALACLISRRNNFILVKFSSEEGSCGLHCDRASFLTTRYILV